jgi:predicted site-specific integrase-resolvase
MDSKIMELRLKQWMPIFEQQAKSGLSKQEWCRQNQVSRCAFFKWQKEFRTYLLEKNKNMLQEQQSTELATTQTGTKFIEIAPVSSSVRSSLNVSCNSSTEFVTTAPISIRYGKFSIELNNDANELLISKVLKAMANV